MGRLNACHVCVTTVQVVAEGEDIVYTYDVYWQESDVEWASRWDAYLRMPNGTVHWFSILNSLLVVLVMSVIVAVILMRTVRRDLAKYEELLVEGQVCSGLPCRCCCGACGTHETGASQWYCMYVSYMQVVSPCWCC